MTDFSFFQILQLKKKHEDKLSKQGKRKTIQIDNLENRHKDGRTERIERKSVIYLQPFLKTRGRQLW